MSEKKQAKPQAKKTQPKATENPQAKEPKKPQVLRWRKIGGGSLRLKINGKLEMIKPQQEFMALRSEIPDAFLDVLECLDGKIDSIKKDVTVEAKEVKSSVYTLKPSESSTEENPTFDITDENGKIISDKPLSKDEAEESIKALM